RRWTRLDRSARQEPSNNALRVLWERKLERGTRHRLPRKYLVATFLMFRRAAKLRHASQRRRFGVTTRDEKWTATRCWRRDAEDFAQGAGKCATRVSRCAAQRRTGERAVALFECVDTEARRRRRAAEG